MGDALVQRGQVVGQAVEFDDDRLALAAQAVELGLDVVAQAVDALGQVARLVEDLLAQGDGVRRRGGLAERGVEVVQASADVRAFAGHQGFQRADVLLLAFGEALVGGGAPQLAVDEVVGDAADVVDLHAPAAAQRGVSAERAHFHAQAAEAGGVDVGDVLPGGGQRHLGGADAAVADLAQETHERFSLVSGRIGWAKAADACGDEPVSVIC